MKTKRIILVVAVILGSLLSVPSFAQLKIGVKGGFDLDNSTRLSDAFDVKNLSSYYVGPALELMLPMSKVDFGIDVALFYSNNKMKVNKLQGEKESMDISNQYLTLPLNAKIKFGLGSEMIKLYGLAGPYVGYLISGDKISFPDISDDIKAKSFEGGLNLGFGFELFRMIQIGANYKIKLTDDYSLEKPEWSKPFNGKSQIWSITAAVFF